RRWAADRHAGRRGRRLGCADRRRRDAVRQERDRVVELVGGRHLLRLRPAGGHGPAGRRPDRVEHRCRRPVEVPVVTEPGQPRPPRTAMYGPTSFAELDLDEIAVEAAELRRDRLDPGTYELVDWESCRFDNCQLAATTWVKSHLTDVAFV